MVDYYNNTASHRARRSQLGLTLLELLITLVIAAMLASVGISGFTALTANQNRLAGTNDLAYTLMLARSEAVKRSQFVTVCRSDDESSCAGVGDNWQSGWIAFANTSSANANTREPDEPLLQVYAGLPGDVALVTNDLANGILTYQPSGDLGVAVTWTWCDGRGDAQARAVVVDPAGRSRVSNLDVDGNDLSCT